MRGKRGGEGRGGAGGEGVSQLLVFGVCLFVYYLLDCFSSGTESNASF